MYIGIDIGGTNTEFGIVNEEGKVIATNTIKTGDYTTANEYVDASVKSIISLSECIGGINNIRGIGIGAPAANYLKGTIEYAANLPWAHDTIVPLANMFCQRLGIPVKVTNDANTVAIGEMYYGIAKGMRNFIVLTLGTGVGSGIVINGQLVYGCDGFAGELGHIQVFWEGGRPCSCGQCGCLETYCSATGVARTAREMLAASSRQSILRQYDVTKITSKDVFNAAKDCDALALDVFDYTGEVLGRACAGFTTFSSPEAYIFFGGLAHSGELLLDPIRKSYERYVLPLYRGKAKFLLSGLDGATAAILGASALCRRI